MPTFEVDVWVEIRQHNTIIVTADDEEGAREKAKAVMESDDRPWDGWIDGAVIDEGVGAVQDITD